MEHSRGRSPSQGHQNQPVRHTPSPSPHAAFRNSSNGLGLDQTVTSFDSNLNSYSNQLSSGQQPSFDANHQHSSFDGSDSFGASAQSYSQGGLYQDQGLPQGLPQGLTADAPFGQQGSNLFNYSNLGDTAGLNNGFDPPLFPDAGSNDDLFGSGALDPQLLGSQAQSQSINPTSLVNPMTSHTQSPTPPHLLSPAMHRQSSGSPHGSPAMQQTGFPQQPSPRHSRNTSLDPSSAAYPQQLQGGEWGGMGFRQHRRQPSDAHSDVSSSAHPSPYLGNTLDSFEQVDHHSPLLGAQQDPAVYDGVMGNISQFSISDNRMNHISPAHSPHISPRLLPQQPQLPPFTSGDNFGMMQSYAPLNHNQFNGQQLDMFPGQGQEAFPSLNQPTNIDYNGNSDAMSPPEINIQLAPPSRQASFEPPKPEGGPDGALSPPDRSRSRNRTRAKSDSSLGRGNTHTKVEPKDMLSPQAAGVGSRSPSPSGKGRRSSTSSVPNRDYILDLADPSRPASNTSGESSSSKRTQKHPATFQCSLCPKRFTRAYNLRSHLRTHTDERPFVCSVCGKAFARQHDRKRHEGLHSGEKKFVCRGGLKDGSNWGCGRRFARADALGRHFRSEAGRVCIKPLLEEEAIERMNTANREAGLPPMSLNQMPGQQGQPMMQQSHGFEPYPGAPAYDPNMQMSNYRLPAALLQQYPTLGGIWDNLPTNVPDDIEDSMSGRNSFDASSGGEYEDDGDYSHPQSGWASDVGPY